LELTYFQKNLSNLSALSKYLFLDLFVLSLPHIVYIARPPKLKQSICVIKEEPPSHKLPEV